MKTVSAEKGDVAPAHLRQKLIEYGQFIEETLKPQLQSAVSDRETTERDIAEYNDLKSQLETLAARNSSSRPPRDDGNADPTNSNNPPPLESLVDLGHQAVYCRAVVDDPRTVYVDVGFGFHVEFTIDEAVAFVDKRVAFLERSVLPNKVKRSQAIAIDLNGALKAIEALAGEVRDAEEREGA